MPTPAKIIDSNLPTVALVGRVNVGKSTLFNKILGANQALISSVAGTTRTSNVGIATWRGKNFRLVDTGGLSFSSEDKWETDIMAQTKIALKEASVIIFVTDIQTGILPQENTLAKKILLRQKKPVIIVANKADTNELRLSGQEPEWLKLGLGAPLTISAQTGGGLGDLLDIIFKNLNKAVKRPKVVEEPLPFKVALAGRPNVGKSSLFNKLIGEDRVIVNSEAHTTREPHDTLVQAGADYYLFVDTAGVRRKTRVNDDIERMGVAKSLEVVRRADLVLLVLNTAEPISDQDQQLAGLLEKHGKSVIIIVNKWDLAEDNSATFRQEVTDLIYSKLPHLKYAPILFTSASSGYRVHQIFPALAHAREARGLELNRSALNKFLTTAIGHKLPTRGKGVRHPKILGMRQTGTNPPQLEVFVKHRTSIHNSYIQYLKNRLRQEYDFYAAPIIIRIIKLKK